MTIIIDNQLAVIHLVHISSFIISGIAWSFRFRSNSRSNKKEMKPTIVITSHLHLAIEDWLARLELGQYKSK